RRGQAHVDEHLDVAGAGVQGDHEGALGQITIRVAVDVRRVDLDGVAGLEQLAGGVAGDDVGQLGGGLARGGRIGRLDGVDREQLARDQVGHVGGQDHGDRAGQLAADLDADREVGRGIDLGGHVQLGDPGVETDVRAHDVHDRLDERVHDLG